MALLAAGRATRFGGRKLDAEFGGRPLWHWAAEAARAAGFTTRLLIGSAAGPHSAAPGGWRIAINHQPEEGIASSIRLAVDNLRSCTRIVLMLADMPFVSPRLLRAIAECAEPAFTRYPDGRRGIPAGFPARCFDRLLTLTGEQGAAALAWPGAICVEPGSFAELQDIDTSADLARLTESFPHGR